MMALDIGSFLFKPELKWLSSLENPTPKTPLHHK